MYHYMHMARNNVREYLKGERVWTKKYFYVLRPLLAVQWIERGLGVVPTEFQRLVDELMGEGAERPLPLPSPLSLARLNPPLAA
jgi:predicted nucleotidyltransferase